MYWVLFNALTWGLMPPSQGSHAPHPRLWGASHGHSTIRFQAITLREAPWMKSISHPKFLQHMAGSWKQKCPPVSTYEALSLFGQELVLLVLWPDAVPGTSSMKSRKLFQLRFMTLLVNVTEEFKASLSFLTMQSTLGQFTEQWRRDTLISISAHQTQNSLLAPLQGWCRSQTWPKEESQRAAEEPSIHPMHTSMLAPFPPAFHLSGIRNQKGSTFPRKHLLLLPGSFYWSQEGRTHSGRIKFYCFQIWKGNFFCPPTFGKKKMLKREPLNGVSQGSSNRWLLCLMNKLWKLLFLPGLAMSQLIMYQWQWIWKYGKVSWMSQCVVKTSSSVNSGVTITRTSSPCKWAFSCRLDSQGGGQVGWRGECMCVGATHLCD